MRSPVSRTRRCRAATRSSTSHRISAARVPARWAARCAGRAKGGGRPRAASCTERNRECAMCAWRSPSRPTGERPHTEVSWGDFLAALPAALAMHPEGDPTASGVDDSRTAPRRALQRRSGAAARVSGDAPGAHRERDPNVRAGQHSLSRTERAAQRSRATADRACVASPSRSESTAHGVTRSPSRVPTRGSARARRTRG